MPDDSTEGSIEAKLDQWLNDHEEIKGMLELTDGAFDALSKVNSWVGTAVGLLKMIGVLGEGPDPFEKLYNALDWRMQQILATERATDFRTHKKDIEELLDKAISAAEGASDFVSKGRPADGSMEADEANSREAVNELINFDGAKWTHVFWPEISGEIAPPTELLSVWDYRYALPAALKAIAARLAVLDAIDADHRETGNYSVDIKKYADKLRLIHEKITRAIRPSPFVSVAKSERQKVELSIGRKAFKQYGDVSRIPAHQLGGFLGGRSEFPVLPIETLMGIVIRCGAIDVWSGSSTITDWNRYDVFKHSDAYKRYDELNRKRSDIERVATETLEKYFELFASETQKRWLALYDALGLDALAGIVTNLMVLARASEVPRSLREMAGVYEARGFPPERGEVSLSVKSVLYWAGIREKASLRKIQNAALKEKLFSYVPEAMKQALTRESLAVA
jgi:hypothetical protein